MGIKRAFVPSRALRLALPTLVIAALGGTAMYLGAPPTAPAEAEDLSLIATGSTVATPAAVPVAATAGALASSELPNESSGGSDCPTVNGFTVTIVSGSPTCAEIAAVADPYTKAVLGDESLGTSLLWSGNGWDCSRNYDETGLLWNAHGLICESPSLGSFVMVSE